MKKLPIDVIALRPFIKFSWMGEAITPTGNRRTPCSGYLPNGLDKAVAQLINDYRLLEQENEQLKAELRERVGQTQLT